MSSENKMGVMPINKLILSMSIPMMLSMLIQALYNIVDSMFVAQISENALTAVSLAFPAQNLMIAVATGTGVGINATLSRSLGEKKLPEGQPHRHPRPVPGLHELSGFRCFRPVFRGALFPGPDQGPGDRGDGHRLSPDLYRPFLWALRRDRL